MRRRSRSETLAVKKWLAAQREHPDRQEAIMRKSTKATVKAQPRDEDTPDRFAAGMGGCAPAAAGEGEGLDASRDALAAERRRMPWMAVEKDYVFEGPKGKVSLLDLFEGRRQLIVYRAFFEPGVFGWPEHACRGCSLGADQVAHLAHLNARDTTLAYASRAPQADIARLKARMGWEMPWYTITDSFDTDFGVDEWHGHNVFIRDGEHVFRTYFINSRGDEAMGTIWSYLDVDAARPPGGVGGFARGLPADPAVQVVELARQYAAEPTRPEVGRGVECRRGGVEGCREILSPRCVRQAMRSFTMSEALGGSDSDATGRERRTKAALGAAGWLSLAAAPTFAIMALLTSVLGSGNMAMICAAGQEPSSLGGMVPMYLLMSAFHLAPWLKLAAKGRSRERPSR